MKTNKECKNYWKNPDDGKNNPEDYLNGNEKTQFLVDIVKKYIDTEKSILEIGCNVGRNLNGLYENNYCNLTGIEINKKAPK